MSAEPTVLVRRDGAIARVVLSRPAVLNAITPEMLESLGAALAALESDEGVRVVVLTGEGRAFSAGVDLKSLGGRPLTGGAVGDLLDVPARAVVERLTTMPQIVIAAVNGHCFTGALELALACDLVVAADEAVFGDTHAKWGLRPTWGMSQRLTRAVGVARARELSYTARTFTGVEAAAWGLAVRSVPRAELDAAVDELAGVIVGNSAGRSPRTRTSTGPRSTTRSTPASATRRTPSTGSTTPRSGWPASDDGPACWVRGPLHPRRGAHHRALRAVGEGGRCGATWRSPARTWWTQRGAGSAGRPARRWSSSSGLARTGGWWRHRRRGC